MRRAEVSPAALGSLALHGAVIAALAITWGSRDLKVGGVTPVTIVASAPDADTRPAVEGPQVQTALSELPAPDTRPDPAATPPTPAPATKAARTGTGPAEKALDLDALASSLIAPARNTRPNPAAKGPTRPEIAPVARQTTGSGLAAGAALQGLAEELQRRWNPNCDVEGGREVIVRVTFLLGLGGQVVGDVVPQIQGPRTPVAQASAERAVRAVYAASPFRGLPGEFYGDRIAVNFNAREACVR